MESMLGNIQSIIQNNHSLAFLAVFAGGLISAASPCVLAAIPLIIGYVGGYSGGDKKKAAIYSLVFIIGLSLTFTVLGAAASAMGQFLSFAGQWLYIGLAAIAVITLALGIGGSTSIFTVVDAALLRGLPYKSPDASAIPDQYKDPEGYWTGTDTDFIGIASNKKFLQEKGLKAPQSWEDLTRPEFAGQICLGSPSTSGTGYTFLTTILQLLMTFALGWISHNFTIYAAFAFLGVVYAVGTAAAFHARRLLRQAACAA